MRHIFEDKHSEPQKPQNPGVFMMSSNTRQFTSRSPNVGLMMGHRLRRWPINKHVKPTLGERLGKCRVRWHVHYMSDGDTVVKCKVPVNH